MEPRALCKHSTTELTHLDQLGFFFLIIYFYELGGGGTRVSCHSNKHQMFVLLLTSGLCGGLGMDSGQPGFASKSEPSSHSPNPCSILTPAVSMNSRVPLGVVAAPGILGLVNFKANMSSKMKPQHSHFIGNS